MAIDVTIDRSIPIKILITDYDACLLTNVTDRPDLLSQDLIDLAKRGDYAAWYGCTHRSYVGYKQTDFLSDWRESIEKYNQKHGTSLDVNCVFTRNITQAFEEATGLKCLGVSTPDDHTFSGNSAHKCGLGYETILKIYEKELMERNASNPLDAAYEYHIFETSHRPLTWQSLQEYYQDNKNLQLIQIMRHAMRIYGPDRDYEFHFFDDKLDNCLALENISPMLLPPNVVFKSFRHYPGKDIFADVDMPLIEISLKLANQRHKSLFKLKRNQVFKARDAAKGPVHQLKYF